MTSPSSTEAPRLSPTSDLPIRRLVVPVTAEADAGHDRGIEVALQWARHWQLPIALMTVTGTGTGTGINIDEHLARTRERLAAATGVAVNEFVLDGPDVVGALTAELGEGDLVVMSSSAGGGQPMASMAWRLLQASGRPTLMVGPQAELSDLSGPVVVGLDGSPLAEQALEPAVGLAAALSSRIWLVQAVPGPVVRQVEELRERGEDASASAYLRRMAEGLGANAALAADQPAGKAVGWEIVQSDDPADAIAGFARDRRAAALVLTTHGRSGLRAAVFGSTCLAIAARAAAPVLVMVPDGSGQAALEG